MKHFDFTEIVLFGTAKGVRQGDPMAPFLFNMVGESLTKMVLQAQQNGLFTGLAPDLIDNGVTSCYVRLIIPRML
jgi:hypothetical protein